MAIVKRLHTYMMQRFLPLLAMTFFICLFIVMMQFLWRYIDDLVGKGLGMDVVAELFWYASLTMVPTALPLAVLLASLMTFGNLGERLELTAMKSAGISLMRIMMPLTVLMVVIAVGAFFFQNDVLPIAQTKMWTLLFSMRQKSPELEIPERSFYADIPGMNLYVEHKDRATGMLHDLIIYDVTRGMDNSRVILADSATMAFTVDKSKLFLHLHSGELFENLQDGGMGGITTGGYLPFRRETFDDKQVYIAFDANFNRIDESNMRSQYIGKNVAELTDAIDSIGRQVDSIGREYGREIKMSPYFGLPYYDREMRNGNLVPVPQRTVHPRTPVDLDKVFAGKSASQARTYITQALAKTKRMQADFEYKNIALGDQQKLMRRHDIERQKKFTLSLACLLFFFIGAPLGSIIKKGGLGTPLVISVALFVFYYIFDNVGYKMARDGRTSVWVGIWLSSMAMLPLAVWFTWKAVGDSAVFDVDSYVRVVRRLLRLPERRHIAMKEVVMENPDPQALASQIADFDHELVRRVRLRRRLPWWRRFMFTTFTPTLRKRLEEIIVTASYVIDKKVISLLNQYPMRLDGRQAAEVHETNLHLAQRLNTLAEIENEHEN